MTGVYGKELDTMQRALSEYAVAYLSYLQSTKEIRETYNAIAQTKALEGANAALNAVRSTSADKIVAAATALEERIIAMWTPNPTLYKRDVIAMLQDGLLKYDAEAIETMARDRYADNPTMLQALRGYLDSHDLIKEMKSDSILRYASKGQKIGATEELKNELLGILKSSQSAEAVKYAADNFEATFAYRLNIIGQI